MSNSNDCHKLEMLALKLTLMEVDRINWANDIRNANKNIELLKNQNSKLINENIRLSEMLDTQENEKSRNHRLGSYQFANLKASA